MNIERRMLVALVKKKKKYTYIIKLIYIFFIFIPYNMYVEYGICSRNLDVTA